MDVVTTTQNTVWARRSYGLEPFQWAGRCAAIDRIVEEKGSTNPTFCQGPNGGLQVTGTTKGTPGLVTTTLTVKESVSAGIGDDLETCLWDIDRRHACRDLGAFNSWDKIVRAVMGNADTVDKGGSSMSEDEEELVTSLPWSAVSQCTIRRVAMAVSTFGGGT